MPNSSPNKRLESSPRQPLLTTNLDNLSDYDDDDDYDIAGNYKGHQQNSKCNKTTYSTTANDSAQTNLQRHKPKLEKQYTSSDTMYTANTNMTNSDASTPYVALEAKKTGVTSISDYHTVKITDSDIETFASDPHIKLHAGQQSSTHRDSGFGASHMSSGSTLGPRIEKIESSGPKITTKLAAALFYGITSFFITVINKLVLTSYKFPSSNLLGVGQMTAIILILGTATQFKYLKIRKISLKNYRIWILATLYFCNLITGLGGTKHLSLPMLIALRRFSIAMTAIGEYFFLNITQTPIIIFAICAMIGGSLIAAISDLTFNILGYTFVMSNNIFTAANVIYIKKTVESKEVSKYELLYYNALITVFPLIFLSYITNTKEELQNYAYWTDAGFWTCFLLSCVLGFLLMLSTVLCTQHNSPLTTTIVGTLKNILTTYIGMFVGSDYVFNVLNFFGLTISLLGSLIYTCIVFRKKSHKKVSNKQPLAIQK